MKAIEVSKRGGPEELKLVEKPDLVAGEGEIVLQVLAAGINFADLGSRDGTYPNAPDLPFVPGFEVAGKVHSLGAGVSEFEVGDRVMAFISSGGYAQQALVRREQVVPLPHNLDFATATALLAQGLTAYFLLESAPLRQGESVLVLSAAGGLGSLAVQIAKLMGAKTVIGTASTSQKRDLVLKLGADAAIDYTQSGWSAKVKDATNGRGVDVFLDPSGDLGGEGLDALATGGRWIVFGNQSSSNASLSVERLNRMIYGGLQLHGYTLSNTLKNPAEIQRALTQLIGWAASGKLQIESGHRFPLHQAAQAHSAIANRQTTGKVVLEP